jgi:hypothetical protein
LRCTESIAHNHVVGRLSTFEVEARRFVCISVRFQARQDSAARSQLLRERSVHVTSPSLRSPNHLATASLPTAFVRTRTTARCRELGLGSSLRYQESIPTFQPGATCCFPAHQISLPSSDLHTTRQSTSLPNQAHPPHLADEGVPPLPVLLLRPSKLGGVGQERPHLWVAVGWAHRSILILTMLSITRRPTSWLWKKRISCSIRL